MHIRQEQASDIQKVSEVTKAAFACHPYSSHTEHLIIDALRRTNGLTLSLLAEIDSKVVGHVAFSAVTIADGSQGWYGLGPVSVAPGLQQQGIGKALITRGLALLREAGAGGCVLVGEPGYYERFGFKNNPDLTLENVQQEYFLALPFIGNSPRGIVTYHEAFSVCG